MAIRFVFFPDPLPLSAHASTSRLDAQPTNVYYYGWEDAGTLVVAGGIEALTLADAQQRLRDLPSTLAAGPRGSIRIIAESVGEGKEDKEVDPDQQLVSLKLDNGIPRLASIAPAQEPYTIIIYTPPSPSQLQFLSLLPLQLDLTSFSTPSRHGKSLSTRQTDDADDENIRLSGKLRQSARLDFSSPTNHPVWRKGSPDLQLIVDRINLSPHLNALLSPTSRPSFRIIPFSFYSNISSLRHPFRLFKMLANAVLTMSNWELPFLNGTAPKDLSATIQQIDTRLSQALSWPAQYSLIRNTLADSSHATESHLLAVGRAHYIHFYNTMWLIANDVIIGGAVSTFFCENSEYIGRSLGAVVQKYTLNSLREALLWLNDWPGGVKLNYELASVFCDAFLWGTGLWEDYIFTPLLPHLPMAIYVLGLSSWLGTTMFLSCASDLLSLLTFHIYLFYLLATAVFSWHLSMLGALFNIFRGKKYNLLRKRVEPAVYEVDQLLLGTILFTLAAFLFPTVLFYYLTFAATRLVIVIMHASMETALAFMNHFPLFAVMLRLKDSGRLPGGLQFELCEISPTDSSSANQECAGSTPPPYLKLKNNALGLAGIFFAHLQLSRRLASHYSPVYLLGRLLSGKTIGPIPRVRLSYFSVSNVESQRDKVD